MKNAQLLLAATLFAAGLSVSPARAEVDSLTIRFGGGCSSKNAHGSCTLHVSASGTDLNSDAVDFQRAANSSGPFKNISSRPRRLSASGRATGRFRNVPVAGTCYRAATSENGNDTPDVISNTICIK